MPHAASELRVRLEAIASALRPVRGLHSIEIWDKVAGKERVYARLTRRNGGRGWHAGHGALVHVAPDGTVTMRGGYAGAETCVWHTKIGTMQNIANALAALPKYVPPPKAS